MRVAPTVRAPRNDFRTWAPGKGHFPAAQEIARLERRLGMIAASVRMGLETEAEVKGEKRAAERALRKLLQARSGS